METHGASAHTRMSNLRLLVVLHGHGDDVQPDDDGDEQVQVLAGAHLVDDQAGGGVVRVVRLTLSFCWKFGEGRGRGRRCGGGRGGCSGFQVIRQKRGGAGRVGVALKK